MRTVYRIREAGRDQAADADGDDDDGRQMGAGRSWSSCVACSSPRSCDCAFEFRPSSSSKAGSPARTNNTIRPIIRAILGLVYTLCTSPKMRKIVSFKTSSYFLTNFDNVGIKVGWQTT